MDGSSFIASFASASEAKDAPKTANGADQDEVVVSFNPAVPSFPINPDASRVRLVPFATGSHQVGSSHLRITNIVNFAWPEERAVGQLVAAHYAGSYLAYGLLAPTGKGDAIVRVWDRNSDRRALLKGMKGTVKDIAFSHARDQVILGCVDERGSLFVFRIKGGKAEGKLDSELLLQVQGTGPVSSDDYHRIIWCPYLPEDEDDEEEVEADSPSRLLVLTRNNVATMWNVSMAASALGGPGPHTSIKETDKAVPSGHMVISQHKAAITAAAFAPDGTAMATASLDGQVKFFQVYLASTEAPRCLHEWAPHGGRPVSSLFFLDNHKDHNPDVQFWKYAVTGADNDSELKIWSCENWTCLQTVRLDALAGGPPPSFKAFLDMRAQFLLLSDLARKAIYVLQLQEAGSGDSMRIVSASEFDTPCPFLSLSVLDAGMRKVDADGKTSSELELNKIKQEELSSDDEDEDDDDDFGDDDHHSHSRRQYDVEATVIDMVIVQPKSFQRCKISYQDAWQKLNGIKASSPSKEAVPIAPATIKQEPKDQVVDLDDSDIQEVSRVLKSTQIKSEPLELNTSTSSIADSKSNLESLLKAAAANASANSSMAEAKDKITLLSPDSFIEKGEKSKKIIKDEPVTIDSDEDDDGDDDPVVIKDEVMLDDSEDLKPVTLAGMAVRSGNSSPSREVQDILGDSEQHFVPDDDDDESLDEEDEVDEESSQESSQEIESSSAEEEKVRPVASSSKQKTPATSAWPPKSVPPVPKQAAPAAAASSVETQQLLRKLTDMTALLQSQKSMLQNLKDEVKTVKQAQKAQEKKDADMARKRDNDLKETLKREMDLRNTVLQQQLSSGIHKNVEKNVRSEVSKAMETSQRALTKQMQTLCAASERQVVDSVRALVSSKAFLDTVSRPLGDRVGAATQAAVKEQMTQVIVPALERAFNEILQQTKVSMQRSVQDTATHSKQQAETVLREVREQVKTVAAAQTQQQQKQPQLQNFIRSELESQFSRLAATLGNGSGDNNGFSHPSSVGGASPAVVQASPNSRDVIMQTQAKIKALLGQGLTNEAFQMALSANNLQLVLATCEMVNPENLFKGPVCPLSQTVLLSLLQQLGHNLDHKTELKLKYLQEGVICLDKTDPIVQQHMRPILQGLQEQVGVYMRSNPEEANSKTLRIFVMAIQSLVA